MRKLRLLLTGVLFITATMVQAVEELVPVAKDTGFGVAMPSSVLTPM